MPPRLRDLYAAGDAVEVCFSDADEPEWRPAIVRALQHPGLWVQTDDGHLWFVTNGRRIRPRPRPEEM